MPLSLSLSGAVVLCSSVTGFVIHPYWFQMVSYTCSTAHIRHAALM